MHIEKGSQPVVVADLFCSGTETDILSCPRNVFGISDCQYNEGAGVKCQGIVEPIARVLVMLFTLSACL